jgi:organic radical activating enzyme
MKTVTLSLTNRCNFNCVYCGSKKNNFAKSISLAEVKKLLEFCEKTKIKNLHITGVGEPLLVFEKLLNVMKIAYKKGISTYMNTNASLFSEKNMGEYIKKLKSAGLRKFIFSIDYDHLKFINYNILIKVIKCSLKNNIRVWINVINRKATIEKNFNLIKKIAKDLNGKLLGFSYKDQSHFLIVTSKDFLYVRLSMFAKTDMTSQLINKELTSIPIEKLVFSPCQNFRITLDSTGHILPCCSFYSSNNPGLYSIGNTTSLQKNDLKINNLLKECLLKKLGFLRIYLRIIKNEKLKEKLNLQLLHNPCNLCFWIQRNKNEIDQLPESTSIEILGFLIPRLHIFLETLIDGSINHYANKSVEYIEKIFYMFDE